MKSELVPRNLASITLTCLSGLKTHTYTAQGPARSPRLVELLQCNDAPLESELVVMREVIAGYKRRLSELGVEKRETGIAHSLVREEAQISRELAELQMIISPLRRLRGETLSEIFLQCIDEDLLAMDVLPDSLDTEGFPWVLMLVCRHWKDVVVAFPRLWSTITFQLEHYFNWEESKFTFLTNLLLQRSASHPLRIGMQVQDADMIFPEEYNPLFQVILPSSFRWKCAVFKLPWCLFECLSTVKAPLEMLQSLCISNLDPAYGNVFGTLDNFQRAPHLRELYCHNADYDISFAFPSPVVHYTWHCSLPDESNQPLISYHMKTLKNMPDLEECTLDCTQDLPDYALSSRQITLARLRRLAISTHDYGSDTTSYGHLLGALAVPALKDLSIDLCEDDYSDTHSVIRLLSRSHAQLTALALTLPSLASDDLIQLLELIPVLTTLRIKVFSQEEDEGVSDEVVDRLTRRRRPGQSDCLIPSLSFLQLHTLTCDHELFVDMIESRRRVGKAGSGVKRLEELRLTSYVDLDDELKSRLDECVLNGLNFRNGVQ